MIVPPEEPGRFAGRVALVTGGSRGIGRAVARRLAAAGADVAVTYAEREQEARQVVEEIEGLGRRGMACLCDVGRTRDVLRLVERTEVELGPIDFLAHCAAADDRSDPARMDENRWSDVINTNLTGCYRVIAAVTDGMVRRRFGRIVTVASWTATNPRPFDMAGGAAKAGVVALTIASARAFARFGVRCNAVVPGPTETERLNQFTAAELDEIVERLSPGRLSTPAEVARVVLYLLSDEAEGTAGQCLPVPAG